MLRDCPDVAPSALAIGFFSGLRTAEVTRLRREALDFKQRHVVVLDGNSKTAKTARRRLAAMSNNVQEWPALRRGDPKARVYPEHAAKISKRIAEASKASGAVVPTASEVGDSAGVMHGRYRGLCTRDDAQCVFGIRTIVAMPATA